MEQIASPAIYSGAGTAAIGWYAPSTILGIIGVLIALAGLIAKLYYEQQTLNEERKRTELMRAKHDE